MARRASKKTNVGLMAGIGAGLLVCLIAVVMLAGDRSSRDGGDLSDFPLDDYMARGSLLRDNTYRLSGRVEERFPRGSGELIVLVVNDRAGIEQRLPIIVPQSTKSINIEREQEYSFRVKVVSKDDARGLLYAESVSQNR